LEEGPADLRRETKPTATTPRWDRARWKTLPPPWRRTRSRQPWGPVVARQPSSSGGAACSSAALPGGAWRRPPVHRTVADGSANALDAAGRCLAGDLSCLAMPSSSPQPRPPPWGASHHLSRLAPIDTGSGVRISRPFAPPRTQSPSVHICAAPSFEQSPLAGRSLRPR
jgi:hypothetical protein